MSETTKGPRGTTITLPRGTTIQLFIKHEHLPPGGRVSVTTRAEVKTEDGTITVGEGEAHCFAGDKKRKPDQFRRKSGVKLALKRALAEAGFLRDDRTVIWKRVLNIK